MRSGTSANGPVSAENTSSGMSAALHTASRQLPVTSDRWRERSRARQRPAMGRYLRLRWSGCRDLNPGPQRPERCALTKLRYIPKGAVILALDRFDLTREELRDRATERARVDRLHELRIGVDALGQEA